MKTIELTDVEAMAIVISIENFISDCDSIEDKSQALINSKEFLTKLLNKIRQWQNENRT